MATYTSAGTGLWSAGATWVGGVKPPSAAGHKIVIAAGHTVTYDEASGEYGDDTSSATVANNAIVVNGTLKASRSMSTTLTCRGTLAVASSGALDYGTQADPIPSSYVAVLVLNYSASLLTGKHGLYVSGGSPSKIFAFGVERTRNTTLAANVTAGATSMQVAAATNWSVGDQIALMTNDNDPANSEVVTVSSVSGLTIGISATSKAHDSGKPVGNLSSNVILRGYSASFPSFIYFFPSASSTTSELKILNTALWYLGSGSGWNGTSASSLFRAALTTRAVGCAEGNLQFKRNAIYSTHTDGFGIYEFAGAYAPCDVDDVAIYISAGGTSTAVLIQAAGLITYKNLYVYSANKFVNSGSDGSLDAKFIGGYAVAAAFILDIAYSRDLLFKNMTLLCASRFLECYNGFARFEDSNIGSTSRLYRPQQPGVVNKFTFANCLFSGSALTGDISVTANGANTPNQSTAITLVGVDGQPADNRVRSYWHETITDTTTRYRSTYAVKISPKYAGMAVKYIFTIPAVAGVAQTIKPALRWDTNYVGSGLTKPVLTLSGQGVSQSFTPAGSSVDTWYDTTLTYTPTSTGDITVTVTVQSSNTTGFVWLDGLYHYPMTQSVRHFGYQFLPQAALVADSTITLSEAAALALPVAVNHGTSTITISGNCTTREIYEACMADLCATANQGTAVHILPLLAGASFSTTYNISVNTGCTITGNFTTSGQVTLNGTADVNGVYVSAAGTTVKIKAPNIVSGSRVQLYNLGTSTELLNTTIGSGGVSHRLVWTQDRTIRLRADHADKLPLEVTGLLTSGGLTFLDTQSNDTVYTGNAIDGSAVTEFAADEPNVQIDVSDGDGVTSVQRLYAWFQYWQTTSAGIASAMFGAITAQDAANYVIDQERANVKFDNVTGTPIVIAGGYLYRLDGSTVIAATSGSIQMDPGRAYLAAGGGGGGSGATAAEVWGYATRTLTADPGAAAHATTQAAVAGVPAAVRSNLATELGRIDVAVSTREAESAAASRASTNQTEHDATQSAIAGLPAAPAAATVASAVRSELTTELGRIDAAVSTRLAAASYAAPLDAAGTRAAVGLAAANLDAKFAGIPAAPAAATVASAVRSELATELARVDAAISSRLSAAGYTAAPDVSAVQAAVAASLLAYDAATGGDVSAAVAALPADVAAAVMGASVETGYPVDRVLRIIAAAVAGRSSGGPGGFVARDLTNSRDQITGAADSAGNRTSASYGA